MLRPAKDLVDAGKVKHIDSSVYRDHEHMWDEKVFEADVSGLSQSIEREGVKTPVPLAHNHEFYPRDVLADGHHRIAVAHDIDPDMLVPVQHFEHHNDYWSSRGRNLRVANTGEFYSGSESYS